jgi:hypothetical protein
MRHPVAEAIERGDLDELVRLVDGLAAGREWATMVELRDRCRHAVERGLQLWPAAEYAEYRLALEASPAFAGPVVTETAGRFALGPLWEVAASGHAWAALAPHLPEGPARALVAHERVLRGEDLRADRGIDPAVLELPLVLQAWEPSYPVATYRASKAEFPAPAPLAMGPVVVGGGSDAVDDPEAVEALLSVALPWEEQSNGRVAAVAVDGGAPDAIAVLGLVPADAAPVPGGEALAWLAWCGASGGAYGRRRGGALGRFAAWWTLAALGGVEWPPDPDDLGAALDRLQWMRWEVAGSTHGWSASLAVADPVRGRAWALYAVDDARET